MLQFRDVLWFRSSCHFLVADTSCLKDAAQHRWGAEMTTQGPFILLSDRKKARRIKSSEYDRDAFFLNVTFRHWHSSVKHQRIWTHTFRDYAESDRNHLIFHVIISTWQTSFCENTPRLSCPSTGQTQVQSSKPTAHETEATLKGVFF